MIFESKIDLHLQRDSELARKKPTKIFAKFLYALTSGNYGELKEQQLFTAVAIMQELNKVMINKGITNLQLLEVDDVVYYEDLDNKDNDLAEGMMNISMKRDHITAPEFQHMALTLSHPKDDIEYFIEIDISRIHTPNQAPINIKIYGYIDAFKMAEDESEDGLKERLNQHFSSQDKYDEMVRRYRSQFDSFVSGLNFALNAQL